MSQEYTVCMRGAEPDKSQNARRGRRRAWTTRVASGWLELIH